jgi:hypothetical protein
MLCYDLPLFKPLILEFGNLELFRLRNGLGGVAGVVDPGTASYRRWSRGTNGLEKGRFREAGLDCPRMLLHSVLSHLKDEGDA